MNPAFNWEREIYLVVHWEGVMGGLQIPNTIELLGIPSFLFGSDGLKEISRKGYHAGYRWNGYGIREWPAAIRAITSWSEVEFHNTNQLRQLGVGEEDIPREVERYKNENLGEWKRCRAILKATTGITDDNILDELMNTPLHWPFFNDPLNTANVVKRRSEPFLGDSDWMAPRHVEALERYSGTPRNQLTAFEISELYADDVGLVNEYEAILDRENVNPALTDYRGHEYYENKRRLDELGKQKVEMLQMKQE